MKKYLPLIYKLGYPVFKIYWFFRRPKTQGVRCIVMHDNKILLIKHTYGNPLLTTVGGGIKRNETSKQAAVREAKEEVGLTIENIREVGTIFHEKEFKKDTIHVFLAKVTSEEIQIDGTEIAEAGWYEKNYLPRNTSPLFKEFLNLAEIY